MRNPFKPSFGATPPLLVGRQDLIDTFVEGLESGPGALERATLYMGLRGSGKTALLNAVQDEARQRGWLVVAETATPGFVARITNEHLPSLLAQHDPKAIRRHLSGISLPGTRGGATWTTEDLHRAVPSLRNQLALLADVLAEHETGVLISLDEVHRRQVIDEMRELATTIQHAFREDREVAFVGAGLPESVSDLLEDDVLTFLRRADRHHLGAVDADEVRRALRDPIAEQDRSVADDVLDVMVEGTAGYPFLIQLVGSRVFAAHPKVRGITMEDAIQGVESAHRRMGSLVHEPSLADTSSIGRSFLIAMARDDGPSSMGDIAERLGVDANYASQYRLRLIAAELITPAGYGKVDFALPYLREYLRGHVASTM
ncbi:MAG: ATP-binding protein [Acidimicrobiales bacterium]